MFYYTLPCTTERCRLVLPGGPSGMSLVISICSQSEMLVGFSFQFSGLVSFKTSYPKLQHPHTAKQPAPRSARPARSSGSSSPESEERIPPSFQAALPASGASRRALPIGVSLPWPRAPLNGGPSQSTAHGSQPHGPDPPQWTARGTGSHGADTKCCVHSHVTKAATRLSQHRIKPLRVSKQYKNITTFGTYQTTQA